MKDDSRKSLPTYVNVTIESAKRQVHVRRSTLGDRLRLLEIFTGWMGKLGKKSMGQAVEGGQAGFDDFTFLSENLPAALSQIRENYAEALEISTDLKQKEIDDLEMSEAIVLFKASWNINRFQEQMTSLGKVLGGEGQSPSGSKEQSPSSPSVAVGQGAKS